MTMESLADENVGRESVGEGRLERHKDILYSVSVWLAGNRSDGVINERHRHKCGGAPGHERAQKS